MHDVLCLGIFANGAQHAGVGEAAAQHAAERDADIVVGSLGLAVEDSLGGEDYATQTKAALGCAFFDKCLLNRDAGVPGVPRPSSVVISGFAHCARRASRRSGHLAADDNGAGATLRHPATEPGSTQAQIVVEDKQERRFRINRDGMLMTVYIQRYLLHFPVAAPRYYHPNWKAQVVR